MSANDAAFVEIPQGFFADVRNITRNVFLSQLRIARFDFELFNMDGCERILPNELLTEENGVFEVVAAPRHERDKDVFPQG